MLTLQVTVELKNDLAITGTMHSVDQYLNIKLNNTRVVNEQKYPHMVSGLEAAIGKSQCSSCSITSPETHLSSFATDVRAQLFHPGICCQICSGTLLCRESVRSKSQASRKSPKALVGSGFLASCHVILFYMLHKSSRVFTP